MYLTSFRQSYVLRIAFCDCVCMSFHKSKVIFFFFCNLNKPDTLSWMPEVIVDNLFLKTLRRSTFQVEESKKPHLFVVIYPERKLMSALTTAIFQMNTLVVWACVPPSGVGIMIIIIIPPIKISSRFQFWSEALLFRSNYIRLKSVTCLFSISFANAFFKLSCVASDYCRASSYTNTQSVTQFAR